MRSGAFLAAAGALSLAAISACTSRSRDPKAPLPLAEQGKRVYLAQCIACHNTDPSRDGPVGPAVAGSSLELLRARVIDGSYPPDYKPKRASKAMAPLPHLKGDLEALSAFLASP